MKNAALLLFTLALSNLSAASSQSVSLNDTVTYEGTMTPAPGAKNKEVFGFIQQLTVAAVNLATNTEASNYSVKTTLFLPDGSSKDGLQTLAATEIKSREEIHAMLSDCKKAGANFEKISVSGGSFDTCAFDDGNGSKVWLGDVPFNVVKQTTLDEGKNVIDIEISLFSFGQ